MSISTVYFVSGVSGVGKTSVKEHLKAMLPEYFEVRDFDEGGVPPGADHEWRKQRTREWIEEGNKKAENGKGIIVCGIANPEEIEGMKKDLPSINVQIILLDAEDDVIEKRLLDRNKDEKVRKSLERAAGDVEEFIQNNRNFTPVLRELCKKYKCPSIDTTHIAPEQVAKEIKKLITYS